LFFPFFIGLIFLLDGIEIGGLLLEEAPLVTYWHLGDICQNQILPLRGVVQDAPKVDVGWNDLQVREANLTLKLDNVAMRMIGVRNCQFSSNIIGESILLHSWIEIDADCLWLPRWIKRFAFTVLDDLTWQQCEPFRGATEWWINTESDGGWQWSCVPELQGLINWHRCNPLLPEILEFKLVVVEFGIEFKAWGNKVSSDVSIEG